MAEGRNPATRHLELPPATRNGTMTESMTEDRWQETFHPHLHLNLNTRTRDLMAET
jgi:hypothetical protein